MTDTAQPITFSAAGSDSTIWPPLSPNDPFMNSTWWDANHHNPFNPLDPNNLEFGHVSSSLESDHEPIHDATSIDDEMSRNFTCCGIHLTDFHAVVEHFESCHVVVADQQAVARRHQDPLSGGAHINDETFSVFDTIMVPSPYDDLWLIQQPSALPSAVERADPSNMAPRAITALSLPGSSGNGRDFIPSKALATDPHPGAAIHSGLASLKVYKNVARFLCDRILMATQLSDGNPAFVLPESPFNVLQTLVQNMGTLDRIFSLVHGHEFQARLMTMALTLMCQGHPGFRAALDDDYDDLTRLLQSTLNSDVEKNRILQLGGDDAERFLNLTYVLLDKHPSPFDTDEGFSKHKAHRFVVKLSERCGILPASLNITGVTECSKEPVCGGGLADIFQATYQGTQVALKLLRDFQVSQQHQKNRQKFCREALLWRNLDHHPNVLPFYGINFEIFLPRVCMVSPWMPHGTLMRHIEALGGPCSANVDTYLLEIAEGLKYLHSNKIIHGDLKGNNIFIDEGWHARLADFGLAGWADGTLANTTSNHGGSIRWMAPELHTSETFCRAKLSDVYAFACVAIECYTGKYPFYDIPRDATVILKVIQGGRPKRPASGTDKAMSDAVWDLVGLCWKQNPSERPQMVDVVAQLLGLKCQ